MSPLSFKFYDANKKILGKTLEEHLRMAVCYWHTFNWPGGDPFGGQTFLRPWMEAGDKIEQAKDKLNNAFEFFEKLGIPYFCFHDVDVAPEGKSFSETEKIQKTIIDEISKKMNALLSLSFACSILSPASIHGLKKVCPTKLCFMGRQRGLRNNFKY